MSWSDVIYKFAPFREEVVGLQDMIGVVHDALDSVSSTDSTSSVKLGVSFKFTPG